MNYTYFRRVMEGIDVAPLLAEVDKIPQPWPKDPYWELHKRGSVLYAQTNLVLRYMSAPGHNRPVLDELPAARKILLDLMAVLGGAVLGNVVISLVPPGKRIVAHIDEWNHQAFDPVLKAVGDVPLLYHRHQIPLRVAPGTWFRCGPYRKKMTEELHMQPGEAWWFNNQTWHEVVNESAEDRISMFCDIETL